MTFTLTYPAVLWLDCAQEPHDCENNGCLVRIGIGEPVAWERDGDEGKLLCFECGCRAEDTADG